MEMETFYKAVQKHGVGNWRQIQKEGLHHRTNVNLKDKWRTMMKNPELMDSLQVEFGCVT